MREENLSFIITVHYLGTFNFSNTINHVSAETLTTGHGWIISSGTTNPPAEVSTQWM